MTAFVSFVDAILRDGKKQLSTVLMPAQKKQTIEDMRKRWVYQSSLNVLFAEYHSDDSATVLSVATNVVQRKIGGITESLVAVQIYRHGVIERHTNASHAKGFMRQRVLVVSYVLSAHTFLRQTPSCVRFAETNILAIKLDQV